MRRLALGILASAWLAGFAAHAGGMGSRVFVVERASGSLAVYDWVERTLLPQRIEGLGNLRHATMIFSPDLRYGFLATRSGQVSRIDLQKLERAGVVFTSENSIDNAVSHDGRFVATAEYVPGGVTIVDARDLTVLKKHAATFTRDGETLPPGRRVSWTPRATASYASSSRRARSGSSTPRSPDSPSSIGSRRGSPIPTTP